MPSTVNTVFTSLRDERQQLTERLTLEYAGSVPPGQILAAVVRADRLLARRNAGPDRTALCETVVRHRLAELAATRLDQLVG